MFFRTTLLLMVVVVAMVGCDSGPPTAPISGSVSLDGKPLADAYVEVDATNGTVPTSLDIADGKFSGDVLLGKKTLRFYAIRPSKPNPRLGPTDVQSPFENVLPPKYGINSDIELEVVAAGNSDLSFDLKSK